MTNNIAYIGSPVLNKIVSIAAKKYNTKADLLSGQVQLITLQHEKEVYTKNGHEVASDRLDFVLFDANLNKIGVVKRKEVQNWHPAQSIEKEKAEAVNE